MSSVVTSITQTKRPGGASIGLLLFRFRAFIALLVLIGIFSLTPLGIALYFNVPAIIFLVLCLVQCPRNNIAY